MSVSGPLKRFPSSSYTRAVSTTSVPDASLACSGDRSMNVAEAAVVGCANQTPDVMATMASAARSPTPTRARVPGWIDRMPVLCTTWLRGGMPRMAGR